MMHPINFERCSITSLRCVSEPATIVKTGHSYLETCHRLKSFVGAGIALLSSSRSNGRGSYMADSFGTSAAVRSIRSRRFKLVYIV